eukprot:13301645-Heterocapsa_arctica.AAC.1
MCGASSHGNPSEREVRGCGVLMKVAPCLDDPLGQANGNRRRRRGCEVLLLETRLLMLLAQEKQLPVPKVQQMSREMLLLAQEFLL